MPPAHFGREDRVLTSQRGGVKKKKGKKGVPCSEPGTIEPGKKRKKARLRMFAKGKDSHQREKKEAAEVPEKEGGIWRKEKRLESLWKRGILHPLGLEFWEGEKRAYDVRSRIRGREREETSRSREEWH